MYIENPDATRDEGVQYTTEKLERETLQMSIELLLSVSVSEVVSCGELFLILIDAVQLSCFIFSFRFLSFVKR